ncbi:hypothetical protein [Amycolatopsis orientalis]|uniref:hypothetical protein n=1 Tax=Amycolatopsis orientalis TaxID=31958 RepID=UPI000416BA1A|nr:hypothetical protein [Amycolatopsis orientalis]
MPRKSTPQVMSMKSGGSIAKKILLGLVVLAVIVMVIKFPHDSAEIVGDARDNGETVVDGLVAFFRALGEN